jgi:hypothetical protein
MNVINCPSTEGRSPGIALEQSKINVEGDIQMFANRKDPLLLIVDLEEWFHCYPKTPHLVSSNRTGSKHELFTGSWKRRPLPLLTVLGPMAFRQLDRESVMTLWSGWEDP